MKRKKSIAKHKKFKPELRQKVIDVIKQEYRLRRYEDFKYSLRKFALDIGMNHVHLSQVLQNQRGLSRKKAEQITQKFNLNIKERRRFHLLVGACGKSVLKRNLALMGLRNSLVNESKRESD